ncbi:hypothetical protein BDW60DRAFT_42205 [Aspergillus nidulans var. acristatus]
MSVTRWAESGKHLRVKFSGLGAPWGSFCAALPVWNEQTRPGLLSAIGLAQVSGVSSGWASPSETRILPQCDHLQLSRLPWQVAGIITGWRGPMLAEGWGCWTFPSQGLPPPWRYCHDTALLLLAMPWAINTSH